MTNLLYKKNIVNKIVMNKKEFSLLSFDLNTFTGQARTVSDSSSSGLSELEVIQQACRNHSKQMPEGYKVDYDGREFNTIRRQSASDEKVTDITFGFELKTDE